MSNVVFNKVTMTNFLSYGNVPTEMILDSGTSWGIMGDNRDIGEGGSSRNGAGKSSSYAAIIYAAFGKSIDKLKADDFINIVNGNKMVVNLEFTKGDIQYKISRGRKPTFLHFSATVDGETQDLTLDSMSNTDAEIEKTLGMTYDIFMSTVFMSPHREAFMEMGNPQQRSMIEQMLSLDLLTERAESLKSIRSDATVDIRVLERELELNQTQLTSWEARGERLQTSLSSWQDSNQSSLEALTERLKATKAIPVDLVNEALTKIDENTLSSSKINLAIKGDEYERNGMIDTNISIIETQTDLDRTVSYMQKEKDEMQKATEKLQKELSVIKDEHGDIGDWSTKIELYTGYTKLTRQRKAIRGDIKNSNDKLERMIQDAEGIGKEIDGIENGKCHVCNGHYEDKVKQVALNKSLEKLLDQIDVLTATIDSLTEELTTTDQELLEYADKGMDDLTDENIAMMRKVVGDFEYATSQLDKLNNSTPRDYSDEIELYTKRLNDLGDPIGQDKIDHLYDLISVQKNLVREFEDEISENMDKLSEWGIKTHIELNEIKNTIKQLNADIKRIKGEINPYIAELELHLEEKPQTGDDINTKLDELNKKVTHCNYLIKLLTDSKSFVRRGILERYIPFLNKKINEYTDRMGLPHVVEISTDLNVDLIYMQKSVSYFNLSRGERLRLNIAVTVAFRDLMGMIGKTCNLLLLDEVLDSAMDESGILASSTLLRESASDVFLITHRDDLMGTLDNKLLVIKENGWTRLEVM